MLMTCLKPILSSAESARLLKGAWRERRYGRLRLLLDFYVPYYCFRVTVMNAGRPVQRLLAIDAVTGQLDLRYFDGIPDDAQLCSLEAEHLLEIGIAETNAFSKLEEMMRRRVMMQGFFRISRLEITGEMTGLFYLPCFVGVYERHSRVRIEVVDALTGRLEGGKMRDLMAAWFQQPADQSDYRSRLDDPSTLR